MWMRILCVNLALISYTYADTAVPGINSIHVDPQFVANETGEALIVWNTGGSLGGSIEYSLRQEDKNLFGPAHSILGITTSSQYVTAAMNNHHEALFIWNTVTGSIQYALYDQDAHAMSKALTMTGTTPYSTRPCIALNEEGDGVAIWSDGNKNIQYASYHRIDKAFSKAQLLPHAKTDQDILIRLNNQGDGIAVWYDSNQQALSYAIYKDKMEFGMVKTIANTQSALNPSLVLNDKGEAFLVWNTGSQTTPAGFLQYSFYNKEREAFEELRTLTASKDGLAQNTLPQAVLNNKGQGAIIWSQLTANGKQSIWYALYKPGAKRFEVSKAITSVAPYSTAPQITLNDGGDMMAAWFSTQTGAVQYSIYNKSNKSFGPTGSLAETKSTDQFPQIFLNNQGEAMIIWSSLGAIKYSFYDKNMSKFSIPKVILQR